MNRLIRQLKSYRRQFVAVVRNEFRAVFTDEGALLILVFALLIYSTTYSLAYGPQVLRNVPIGVIDNSHTEASRRLTAAFDAGPNTYVAYEPADMVEARELFFQRRIYGIVYIPENYERRLLDGEQADVAIYADASYFLMYRQVFQELVSAIGLTGATVGLQRLVARGTELPQAEAAVQPVVYQSHNLFNPYLGYGSFAMPAIIIVIIQQTLLIGIGMIGGTWWEKGFYRRLCPVGRRRMSTLPIVAGRASVYLSIYGVTLTYILGVHYKLFHYPDNGTTGAVIVFTALYLSAAIAFGLALSTLFRTRESSLLLLFCTSIPVLMLSGVSFPREGIPPLLYRFGRLLPSSSAIDGFIRIRSMGASLAEVLPEIRTLAILTVVYGGLALFGTHWVLCRTCVGRPGKTKKTVWTTDDEIASAPVSKD